MEITFTIQYPDEPYKNSFSLGNRVGAVYRGPRFLVFVLQEESGIVEYATGGADDIDHIDLEIYSSVPNMRHIIVDAEAHPFEAAFITHNYVNDPVDPYVYTLPDGSTWEYQYGDTILDEVFQLNTLVYNFTNRQFIAPKVIEHPLTRNEFFNDLPQYIERIKSAMTKAGKYSTDELKQLKDHIGWVESLSTTYKDVDHWKIPWPKELPEF